MPDILRISAATVADLDVVIAIGVETYQEHFAHVWSAAGLAGFLQQQFGRDAVGRELTSDGVRYFLARDEAERVVGFSKLRYPRAVPRGDAPDEPLLGVELQKLYLRGNVLARGIGSQLLAACETHARALGLPELWLDVLESNQRAQQLYLRRGFSVVATKTFPSDRGNEPMLVMHKSLGAASV